MITEEDAIRLAKAYCHVGAMQATAELSADEYVTFQMYVSKLRAVQREVGVFVTSEERLDLYLEMFNPKGA